MPRERLVPLIETTTMFDTTTIPSSLTVRKAGHRYHGASGVPKEVRAVIGGDDDRCWETFVTLEMPSGAREEFPLAETGATPAADELSGAAGDGDPKCPVSGTENRGTTCVERIP